MILRTISLLTTASLSAACRLEHPPTPTAVADSTTVARALSLATVPRLEPGGAVVLHVDASAIGGSFAAAFEREMTPAVTFARGRQGPQRSMTVSVDSLQIDTDSAVAIVSEVSSASSTRLRTLLLPRAEGGWRVVAEEVVAHTDSPQLPLPGAGTPAGATTRDTARGAETRGRGTRRPR